eukprot:GHVH01004848.1.p1 GENE.GHVH01004848.1~~GHVH01004848.1.p1  ORF type:complete len:422 (+),score=58.97 GHVH01004848.1:678-1943(+)
MSDGDEDDYPEVNIIETDLVFASEDALIVDFSRKTADERLQNSHFRFRMRPETCKPIFYLFVSKCIATMATGLEVCGYNKKGEGAIVVLPVARYRRLNILIASHLCLGSISSESILSTMVSSNSFNMTPTQSQSSLPTLDDVSAAGVPVQDLLREHFIMNDNVDPILQVQMRLMTEEDMDRGYLNELELDSSGGRHNPVPLASITKAQFPELQHLTLRSNHSVKSIYDLPRLLSLHLEDCQGLMYIGQAERECASLIHLSISHCNKLHHPLEPQGRHRKLRRLHLQDMVTPIISQIGAFQFLEELKLRGCPEVERIDSMPRLKILDVEDCPRLNFGVVDNKMFPLIEKVFMRSISSLRLIDDCQHLRDVELHFDPEEQMSCNLRGVVNCPNLLNLSIFPRKRGLIIKNCPKLRGWSRRQSH